MEPAKAHKIKRKLHKKFLSEISQDKRFDVKYLQWAIDDAIKREKMISDIRGLLGDITGETGDRRIAEGVVNYMEDHGFLGWL
jgi:hypothetical protein